MLEKLQPEFKSLLKNLEKRLQLKHQHMSSIFTVTQMINSNYKIDELYSLYQEYLEKYLKVSDFAFYVYEDAWKLNLNRDTTITPPDSLNITVATKYKKSSRLNEEDTLKFGGYKYIIPVYYNDTAVAFSFLGEIDSQSVETKIYLIQYAQVLTNIVTMAVENKRLLKKEMEKIDYDKEMELASKIQGMIIPKRLPKNHLYEFAGLYLPHRSIGGDYYDVININKDEFVFCMGDISGKGVAAALVMANLQAYLNASPPSDMANGRDLVDRLNSKIYSITSGEKFITLFIAKYNILTRELQYLNAGHNPPVLINGEEAVTLNKGCALLGILDYIPKVETGKIVLKKDALILTYTDGLIELENNQALRYGEERLKNFTVEHKNLSSEDLLKRLYNNMINFKGYKNFSDDVSVLIGKFF